jgi:transcriptional regulator with XRE-family HTH domain
MSDNYDHVKLAIALRTARSAIGWSQDELARNAGIPKITLARVETLDGSLKAEHLMRLLDIYKSMGVTVDLGAEEGFTVTIDDRLLDLATLRFQDDAKWRADRKRTRKFL